MEWLKDSFKISTDDSLLDISAIHQYLSTESYWAKNISRERVERACKNSLCFGVYDGKKQIGLARVITDYAVHAHISDVYILPAYQRKGLGKWLLSCIMTYPDLKEVRRLSLGTRDAHGLYRQFGFSELTKPQNSMEYRNLDAYNEEWKIE